jgi:cell wall-associated NlpC family hydrolase
MSRYRRRRWRSGRRLDSRSAGAAVAAGVVLAVLAHAHAGAAGASAAPPSGAAVRAIAYAQAQIGKPYVWGGTGPDGFDCSGLVMDAYASAGVSIPRTSQDQWAAGPQVSSPQPGDLVFFAGADGTSGAPGHVGLVIGPHTMIEAYASGFPVRVSAFGDSAAAPGDGDPVGFTAPWESR